MVQELLLACWTSHCIAGTNHNEYVENEWLASFPFSFGIIMPYLVRSNWQPVDREQL